MTKEENRFQERKHKEKARKLIKDVWHEPELADDGRFVGVWAGVHGRKCSCPMCKKGKNPKKDPIEENEEADFQGC